MPRKSRIRGSPTESSLSTNWYMRAPRSVTLMPIGRPARSLKFAIALRDFSTTGCWPVIFFKSAVAGAWALGFEIHFPVPVVATTLVKPGTLMAVGLGERLVRAGAHLCLE